ncbi:MAG: hypothetical protein IJ629_06475 [Clostridia bacterium]|nr:hypothetical protein [Clostridia bacterium]
MAKKVFLITIFAIVLLLGLSTVCFAKVDNTTTTLNNEVTNSMNKTERSMDDLVDRTNLDKAGQAIENGARAVGNVVSTGMDDIGRGTEDLVDGRDDTRDDTRTDNRSVAGTTGNYTAGQIGQTDPDVTTGRNGMTQNAWIWIVMVVVALIIVAAVWYYAAQRD